MKPAHSLYEVRSNQRTVLCLDLMIGLRGEILYLSVCVNVYLRVLVLCGGGRCRKITGRPRGYPFRALRPVKGVGGKEQVESTGIDL